MGRIWRGLAVAAVAAFVASTFVAVPSAGAGVIVISVTDVFDYTGAPQSFVVPDGVTEIDVELHGASGQASRQGVAGGLGAKVAATLTVAPGARFAVMVGGRASDETPFRGGWNGGGDSPASADERFAGGGGGSTDFISQEPGSPAVRLIVAGGGGGAGGGIEGLRELGGAGGASGSPGGSGDPAGTIGGGAGGGAGTASEGGAGGFGGGGLGQASPGGTGKSGTAGAGGKGGFGFGRFALNAGGGGGGGYFGGGGGGGGSTHQVFLEESAGGGGGGGSSFITADASSGSVVDGVRSGDGVAVISYEVEVAAAAPVVVDDPVDVVVEVGGVATFSAGASGVPVPSVQWQRADVGGEFVDISGATSGSFSLTAGLADDGARFRAVFTNSEGSVTSASAELSVAAAPVFTSAGSASFTVGSAGSFTVAASSPTGTPGSTSLSVEETLPSGLTFTDGGDGTGSLAGTPDPGVQGTHPLTFVASNDVGSTSQAFELVIGRPVATVGVVTSSVNPSVVGEPVTFRATVQSDGGSPSGSVTFREGDVALGTVSLVDGVASLSTSALSVGEHVVTASYGGDATFPAASSAGSVVQRVGYRVEVLAGGPARPPGASVLFRVVLRDFGGANLSAGDRGVGVVGVVPTPAGADAAGSFTFDRAIASGGGYRYVLRTRGYRAGSYELLVRPVGDPVVHRVPFVLRSAGAVRPGLPGCPWFLPPSSSCRAMTTPSTTAG